jgi:beta-lactamase superfamily II metal-dependent hydrolase
MSKSKRRLRAIFLFSFFLATCTCSSKQNLNVAIVPEKTNSVEIHIINVGQGDCFLIVSPSGRKVLIDAGNTGRGAAFALPYLKDLGITSIDYIVASHYHSDHIGGLDEVVNGIGGNSHIVSAAFDRGGNYNSGAFRDYVNAMGDKRKTISPGQTIDLGDNVTMKCVASNGDIPTGRVYSGTDENTLSVVIILKFHSFDMYFGGDSNSAIEPSLAPYAGDVDVYKVSHHGSATSSSHQLLDYLKPEVSVIAVGNGNTYGHPNAGTISRLVSMNSYIYQTESGSAVPPVGKGEIANGNFKIVTDGYSYMISGASLTPMTRLTDSRAPEGGIINMNNMICRGFWWERAPFAIRTAIDFLFDFFPYFTPERMKNRER